MVKVRLSRVGARGRPFYRVVAIDERERRDGRPLEYLGTYDPLPNPERLEVRTDRIEAWVARGAQLSDAVRTLLRRARHHAPAAPAGETPPATPDAGAA